MLMWLLAVILWHVFIIPSASASSMFSPVFVLPGIAVAGLLTIILYFRPPHSLFFGALGSYTLTLGIITATVLSTGFSVALIASWLYIVTLAPLFGFYGVTMVIAVTAGYAYIDLNFLKLNLEDVATLISTTVLPLILGSLLWSRSHGPDSETSAVRDLAGKLSTISGQSEIVIAAIADGVVTIGKNSDITLINPSAARMLGWNQADALNLDYHSVIKLVDSHDQPLTKENDPVAQALATNKEVATTVFRIETAESGKRFQADITASPLGTQASGVIIVFRDITAERAEERQQAEFISTASHEMRTPVASIEGYLGLALNPATAAIDEKAREYITKAHESAQHLGRLFQDLLDVSKADDGRLQNNPVVIDLVPFVGDIITGLMPSATQKNLFVNYKPSPDTTTGKESWHDDTHELKLNPAFFVEADADHLREVMSNLVENAIKYTLKGSVTIDVTGDNQHVIVSVADSGIGIPREDISHLFQKFYRVDNRDTREIGGTGLGLYLSRRLIEAIGGQIWVESEYRKGSTFFVKLPRMDAVEARRKIESLTNQAETPAIVPVNTPVAPPTAEVQPIVAPNPIPAPTPVITPQVVTPPTVAVPVPNVAPVVQYAPAATPTPAPAPLAPPAAAPTLAEIEQSSLAAQAAQTLPPQPAATPIPVTTPYTSPPQTISSPATARTVNIPGRQ